MPIYPGGNYEILEKIQLILCITFLIYLFFLSPTFVYFNILSDSTNFLIMIILGICFVIAHEKHNLDRYGVTRIGMLIKTYF
jgi:hypothetical protein